MSLTELSIQTDNEAVNIGDSTAVQLAYDENMVSGENSIITDAVAKMEKLEEKPACDTQAFKSPLLA